MLLLVPFAAYSADPFQLHSNGQIWEYTGTPCSGDSCPGWRMLDNNPRTVAIAAGLSRQPGGGRPRPIRRELYQLHNDGAIWRYTGTPCSGASCPGWRMLDNNPRTVAIAAGGGPGSGRPTPIGRELYQLHNDGAIWRYTGTPCSGSSCPGWEKLDNNPNTRTIVAAADRLYQLHNGGDIWRYTGTPCSGSSCPGWEKLDNNPNTRTIVAAADRLYQLHNNGEIWRYIGPACGATSCLGWQLLDNNPITRAIVAAGDDLYQLHEGGAIWRYTGTPCTASSCPGWQRLLGAVDNPDNGTISIVGLDFAGSNSQLYMFSYDGGMAGNNLPIVSLRRYTGPPCSGNSCPGWEELDLNPSTVAISDTAANRVTTQYLHVSRFDSATLPSPVLSNADVDRILSDAGNLLQNNDGTGDVSCNMAFARSGDVTTFTTGNGNINSGPDYDAVVGLAGNVKVVNRINWCSVLRPSFIGCAFGSEHSFVVVRHTTSLEGILWAHEYGHNKGLGHRNNDANALMNQINGNTRTMVNANECAAIRRE